MQRPGEQHHIGERDRLRERVEPVVEPLARGVARQRRLLRRQLLMKQPDLIDPVNRGSTERFRGTVAGAMLAVTGPNFKVAMSPEEDTIA